MTCPELSSAFHDRTGAIVDSRVLVPIQYPASKWYPHSGPAIVADYRGFMSQSIPTKQVVIGDGSRLECKQQGDLQLGKPFTRRPSCPWPGS